MSVLMPTSPAPQQVVMHLVDWNRMLTPQMGGDLQQLNRLGSRFSAEYTMPKRSGDIPRAFLSKLRQAKQQGILIAVQQIGLTNLVTGAPVVNGAGQSGMTLNLKGFAAGAQVRDGQFLSLIVGGRRYLHHATADMTAASDGTVSLPIFPMLRVQPGDGAICEFAQPMIEGLLTGNEVSWTLARFSTDGVAFSVMEQS